MGDTDTKSGTDSFVSKLEKPPQRFLAHVIEHCLEIGRRSAADFIRHFPARAIMDALERRPDLRADILVPTTGINHKVALRKSASSSGEDLQIALDEGVSTPVDIVGFFRPDDRVRYLDNRKLWGFVTEGEFWKTDKSKGANFQKAKSHIAFMLDRGLIDGLLTHSDLVDGVSVETLAQSLPREKLGDIINAALAMGRDKKAFTERDLLATAAAAVLVEDVSLVHIWETVLIPKVAEAHGLVDVKSAEAKAKDAKTAKDASPAKDAAPAKAAPAKDAAPAAQAPAKKDAEPAKATDTKIEASKPVKVDAVKAKDVKAKGPTPGMPKAKPAKADAKPAKAKKASEDDEVTVVETDNKPAGLEELLVDVDDFEIEEIEEEYSDQATP